MHNVISAKSPKINEPLIWSTRIISAGRVTAADISALRNEIFPLGLMSRQDGEALFAIDHIVLDKAPGWTELVVELVTDLVVWGERPTGAVSQIQAEWIIGQVDAALSGAALATLAALLDEATVFPSWFMSVARRRLAADWRRIGLADLHRAAA